MGGVLAAAATVKQQQALAAMMLAEIVSKTIRAQDQQSIESWAHELGLTSSEAIAAVPVATGTREARSEIARLMLRAAPQPRK